MTDFAITEREKRRHDVRPGLTGLAQINGRNVTQWDERLETDVRYVENITFLGDLKIVGKTIVKTIKRSDVLMGNEISAGRLDVVRKK